MSWINADSLNLEIDYLAPSVTNDTNYNFQLVANWLTENQYTTILILVTYSDSDSGTLDIVAVVKAFTIIIIF